MPAETTGRTVYYVLRDAVSKERLEELTIRIIAEETLGFEEDPVEEPIPCWAIAKAGVQKLAEYGYDASVVTPTGYDGIMFVALANPDGTPATVAVDPKLIKVVTFASWIGTPDRAVIKAIIQRVLTPAIGKHVKVFCPGGNRLQPPPVDDNTVAVIFHSSTDGGEWFPSPAMWGRDVSNQNRALFAPWVGGEPITSSEGEEVGAAGPKHLYIYPDLLTVGNANDLFILEKFFESYIELAKTNFGGTPDYDNIEKRYVTACRKRVDKRKIELKHEFDEAMRETQEYEKNLVLAIQRGRQARHELDNFDSYIKDVDGGLRKEFRGLLKVPKVANVNWRGDNLTITTKHCYCQHPNGTVYDIGVFKLIVDHRTSEVRFFNQTRRVNSFQDQMNGPHLFPDGRPCLGNMREVIPQLVAGYQWSALTQVCFAFIEAVNLDDNAGQGIVKWPVALTKEQLEEYAKLAKKKPGEVLKDLGIEYSHTDVLQRLQEGKIIKEVAAEAVPATPATVATPG
jgi:hypothetical protein